MCIRDSNGYSYGHSIERLIKFDDAGRLVTTFGDNGIAQEATITYSAANQIVEQADGKFVAFSGYSTRSYERRGTGRMVRYNADGTRDASFGEIYLPGNSTALLSINAAGNTLITATESRVLPLATSGKENGPARVTKNGTLTLEGTTRSESLTVSIVQDLSLIHI